MDTTIFIWRLADLGQSSGPIAVNDDSCGVHSTLYHSGCDIACVMQVREEHAMGHDPGGGFSVGGSKRSWTLYLKE